MEKLLSKETVVGITSLSFVTIWKMMREGTFPRSLVVGRKKVAWRESDVKAWLDALPQQSLMGDPGANLGAIMPKRRRRRRRRTKLGGE